MLEQDGAALVGGERFFQAELAGLHALHEGFEFGQRRLERQRRLVICGLIHWGLLTGKA
jgi:hypothetical protein